MASATESFNAMCKANIDAARKLTAISFEGIEHMLGLPFRITREVIQSEYEQPGVDGINDSLNGVLKEWSESYDKNAKRIVDVTQTYFETTSRAHAELIHFIRDEMGSMN